MIILPWISLVVSVCFIIWSVGWVSSFYNNVMFLSNNLVNCLVFGEQLNHSGQNYRGNNIWWIGFLTLVLNSLVICVNFILLVRFKDRKAG
jgi:hypothetical protein